MKVQFGKGPDFCMTSGRATAKIREKKYQCFVAQYGDYLNLKPA